MRKNNTMMGFFSLLLLLQPNQTLRQKENWFTCKSFVLLSKCGHFLTCLDSKVFYFLEINFSMEQTKKLFFFFFGQKSKASIKQMLALYLLFFQNKSKNNRDPALAFAFSNERQKLFRTQIRKFFLFFVFFIYQKTKLTTDKLFSRKSYGLN